MPTHTRKTTKAEFERFKRSFLRWAELFGLSEWKFYFRCEALDNAYAEFSSDVPTHVGTLTFNAFVLDHNPPHPEETGLHEAVHVAIARLRYLAGSRYITSCELDEEDEALTRRIQHVIETLSTQGPF